MHAYGGNSSRTYIGIKKRVGSGDYLCLHNNEPLYLGYRIILVCVRFTIKGRNGIRKRVQRDVQWEFCIKKQIDDAADNELQ